MDHCLLGGLTKRTQKLQAYSNIRWYFEEPSPVQLLPTNVHSIASDTLDAGRTARKPKRVRVHCSQIIPLGSHTYDGSGLYPLEARNPYFILRSVLHPTGWCRRQLTEDELWTVNDVPHNVLVAASSLPDDLRVGIRRQLLPGRCLQYGLRGLLEGIGILDHGGGFVSKTGRQAMAKLQSS